MTSQISTRTLALLAFTASLCVFAEDENGKRTSDVNTNDIGAIEEVVVTGTLNPAGIHSAAVPITTISSEELAANAPADFKDIIRNLSFNVSSLGLTSTNWVGDDSSYGNASINVRNLGNGATLVLLNGKRMIPSQFNQNGGTYVDIQTLVPNIALARVDVLKEGTSAIYGSDAVAGVVNLITKDDFRGLDIQFYVSLDHESRTQSDTNLEVLLGTGTDRSQFTFSASLLDRSALTYSDRFDRFGKSGLSSFGQPGRFVPLVDDEGPQSVETNFWWPQGGPNANQFRGSLPDLECDQVAEDDGEMGTLGIHPNFSHICVYDYSSFFSMVRAETQYQLRMTGKRDLGSNGTLYSSVSHFKAQSAGGNSYYPDIRFVVVPEHNIGLQLDSARRGFDPVPYQALQRVVGGNVESTFDSRPLSTRDNFQRTGFDFLGGLHTNWLLLNRNWDVELSIATSQRKISTRLPTDSITERMNLAFDGLGGPNCDAATGSRGSGNFGTGNCFYYNSFQTSVYDPATGNPWVSSQDSWAPNPRFSVAEAARLYQNTPELLQWLQGTYRSDRSLRQRVLDFIAFTDLTIFNGLPVGFAIGAQTRNNETTTDYDDISNMFGFAFLSGNTDWTNTYRSWSLFTELHIPLGNRTNLYTAFRREEIEEPNAVSLDPKISIVMQPRNDLSLRMSWGTSFRVGSLLQTGGSRTIFQNSSDPFSNAASLAYRASQAQGNSNLEPETAESISLGFSWEPQNLEGLKLGLDWYQYDYDKLVIREGHQALIDLDNTLRCPNGINGNSANGPLCGVWDHDLDGIETVFSIGAGLPGKVIRREDGYLVRTEPSYLNANRLNTHGLDATARYSFQIQRFGDFELSASMSRFLSYELTLASGSVIDGLGRRNASNAIARPMPKFRMQTSLAWRRQNSRATLSVNTIGGYRDESTQSAFLGAYLGYAEQIDAMTTLDMQYQWCTSKRFTFNTPMRFIVGAKNLLNREPPLVIVDGAYDYYLHDPRGRIYYARVQFKGRSQATACVPNAPMSTGCMRLCIPFHMHFPSRSPKLHVLAMMQYFLLGVFFVTRS